MSWQSYMNDHLHASGKYFNAAIISKQGNVWAISNGYNISKDEKTFMLQNCFSNNDLLLAQGIRISGTKFVIYQSSDSHISGRSLDKGLLIFASNQAFIIGEYDRHSTELGEAFEVIERLAEHLKNNGL